jgi:hypothetical protein
MKRPLPFLVLLAVGWLAMAAGPPLAPVTPAADKATLYIYRPSAEFNWAGYPEIYVNGEKKFRLQNGRYAVLTLPPGEYELKAEGSRWGTNWWPGPTVRTLTVKAGHEYYVRVIPVLPPGVKAGPHLFEKNNVSHTLMTLVPKEQALKEIAETRLTQ